MSSNKPTPEFELAGVNAMLVRMGNEMRSEMPTYLKQIRDLLLQDYGDLITQVTPAYNTLLVEYDPRTCRMYDLQLLLEKVLDGMLYEENASCRKLVEIPVCYAASYAPDLEQVARHCKLTTDEVIKIHSSTDYQVYALGFAPAFAYLGQLDKRLQVPRLSTPRQKVPAGTVAIAEQQTAVYPCQSPGGWNLIGFSPMQWFNPEENPMTPVEVGDCVRFVKVSEAEMKSLEKQGMPRT